LETQAANRAAKEQKRAKTQARVRVGLNNLKARILGTGTFVAPPPKPTYVPKRNTYFRVDYSHAMHAPPVEVEALGAGEALDEHGNPVSEHETSSDEEH
jgi:hypothetical protein